MQRLVRGFIAAFLVVLIHRQRLLLRAYSWNIFATAFPDVPHRSISERRAMLEEAALVYNRRASRGIEEALALTIRALPTKLDDRLERTVLVLSAVHWYLPNMLGSIQAVSFKQVAATGRPPAFPLSGLCSISSQPLPTSPSSFLGLKLGTLWCCSVCQRHLGHLFELAQTYARLLSKHHGLPSLIPSSRCRECTTS